MKTESGHPPASPEPAGLLPVSPVLKPPSGLALWWLAIRPRTLTIAIAPVLAGSVLAYADRGEVSLVVVMVALLGALAIQAGTNLYNDVADYLRGGDQPLRQGPPRVTAMGWALPGQVKRAAFIAFAAAALCGIYLALVGGWAILLLGLASMLAGYAYSLGPRPIADTPLGEVFVTSFFGLGAVGGCYYLQTQTIVQPVLAVGLALGLIASGVLMANNYRDMEPDRLAGRRTLAIVGGPEVSKILYALFLVLPFALVFPPLGPAGGWMTLPLLPVAFGLVRRFSILPRGPAFNVILVATARFELYFVLLLALGALL